LTDYAFVDTSFLVARFHKDDRGHAKAIRFMGELAAGPANRYRLVTSEYVFDETVTTLHAVARRHELAVDAGNAIRGSRTMKLMEIDRAVVEAAWELFKERHDKRWSFTDCVSFTLMRSLDIRCALSFDDNFKQAGFATLP
jgi:predicted nucleic acid-binding protein